MSFGLHMGWAIEGAIGSDKKIEASYLSPNVNISARLKAASEHYGVDLLFSGDLHKLLSPGFRDASREIDTITVKGSSQPVRIYTVHINAENLNEETDKFCDLSLREKR
jgi:class 3 adenylate cyclase